MIYKCFFFNHRPVVTFLGTAKYRFQYLYKQSLTLTYMNDDQVYSIEGDFKDVGVVRPYAKVAGVTCVDFLDDQVLLYRDAFRSDLQFYDLMVEDTDLVIESDFYKTVPVMRGINMQDVVAYFTALDYDMPERLIWKDEQGWKYSSAVPKNKRLEIATSSIFPGITVQTDASGRIENSELFVSDIEFQIKETQATLEKRL